MNQDKYSCRVCGFRQTTPPWGEDGDDPSFNFCPCCGVEFGYGDATKKGIDNHLRKWIASGYKWFDESQKPKDWQWKGQPQ